MLDYSDDIRTILNIFREKYITGSLLHSESVLAEAVVLASRIIAHAIENAGSNIGQGCATPRG